MVSMAMILSVTANPIAQDAAVRRSKQLPHLRCVIASPLTGHPSDDAPDSSDSAFAPHNPIRRGVTASAPRGYGPAPTETTSITKDKPTTTLSHYSFTPPPAESTSSVLTSVSIPVSSSVLTSSDLSSQTPYVPVPSSSVGSSVTLSSATTTDENSGTIVSSSQVYLS